MKNYKFCDYCCEEVEYYSTELVNGDNSILVNVCKNCDNVIEEEYEE